MKKFELYMLLLFLFYSCDNSKILKEYYSNGSVKTIGKLVNGEKHGEYVTYYENGNIEYKGKYYKGKKTGKHTIFFKDIKNQKKFIVVYDSLSKDQKILHKYIFNENDIATYDATIKYINLDISILQVKADTVYVKLSLTNPKYEFFDFYIGETNAQFKDGKKHLKFYQRDNNNYVIVPYFIGKMDTLVIQGYLSNYNIKPIIDTAGLAIGTIGVTIGDEIFFNQKLSLYNDTTGK